MICILESKRDGVYPIWGYSMFLDAVWITVWGLGNSVTSETGFPAVTHGLVGQVQLPFPLSAYQLFLLSPCFQCRGEHDMPRSYHRCRGAWESHPEALPVLQHPQNPREPHWRDRNVQMRGLPVEGQEKWLYLCSDKHSAPAGRGEPSPFDSELWTGDGSPISPTSQHLEKWALDGFMLGSRLLLFPKKMHLLKCLAWLQLWRQQNTCSALRAAVRLHLDLLVPCFRSLQDGSSVILSNCRRMCISS